MKITVTSTYENVDGEWLHWWLNRLMSLPENEAVAHEIMNKGFASYTSKDPSSEVVATTTYKLDTQ